MTDAPEFDFGYADIAGKTQRVELPQLRVPADSEPSFLICQPANDENPRYNAAILRTAGKRRRTTAGTQVSKKDSDRDRDEDRRLYPKFVIVGWGNIYDTAGKPVDFSQEACEAFVAKLPNWLFDKVRVACMRGENFVDEDEDLPDEGTLAGN
jgi:hypothetical protein